MSDFENQVAKIISGTALAESKQKIIKQDAERVNFARGAKPCIAVVLVGDHPSSLVYVSAKQKACEKVGIESRVLHFPSVISQSELLKVIYQLNNDSSVDGVLIQFPLPNELSANLLLDALNPAKDVDGLTPHSLGLLVSNRPSFIPCTPLGCMDLIKQAIDPAGKKAVVFGRSILVGRPMALLLEDANATVTTVHSKSYEAKEICQQADIVVAAIGRPKFITSDYIKPGAVVIDVGITRSGKNLIGDVDESVSGVAGWVTTVPGGVGPMTITKLLSNTVLAAQRTLK